MLRKGRVFEVIYVDTGWLEVITLAVGVSKLVGMCLRRLFLCAKKSDATWHRIDLFNASIGLHLPRQLLKPVAYGN